MFINLRLYFQVGSDNLSDMLSRSNRLTNLRIEIAHLSINRCLHFQVLYTLTYQRKATFHIPDVLIQTGDLTFPENIVLTDTLINHSKLFFCCHILFAGLKKILTSYKLFLHQAFILLVTPLPGSQFFIYPNTFLFQTQSLLLHTDTCITQFIFLISKVGFTLHNTNIE